MKPYRTYDAVLHDQLHEKVVADALTVEVPLEIRINGEPLSVTMQTPGHETDLVRGLLYCEDIFRNKEVSPQMQLSVDEDRNLLQIQVALPENAIGKGYLNSRQLLSVASCGICGRTSFEPKKTHNPLPRQQNELPIERQFDQLKQAQELFALTGGCHGAAAFDKAGTLLVAREDIGRHNAVDKVIGALLNQGTLDQAKSLLVSGRISYEIVAKCFMAGIPTLAAVSAPSSMAVDFAKEFGLQLIAFCRDHRMTVYS